jgi:RNA polymerase sigma factor (sigma-70 family)
MMRDVTHEAAHELIPTRNSLLGRLKDWDDEASWRDFFDTYWKLIYLSAVGSGLTDAEAQDVVQETVIEVCRRMPTFHYEPKKGAFKSWLLKLTFWRVTDQLRRRQRRSNQIPLNVVVPDEELEQELPPAAQEMESLWENEWQRNLMAAAVQRVKTKVNARQFQIFDLCVIQEWPIARVTKTLKINRGQVYLAKHRVSSQIKKELQELERHPLPFNTTKTPDEN